MKRNTCKDYRHSADHFNGVAIDGRPSHDDPAVALYTKLGVREDVLHFDIAVEDDNKGDQP